MKRKTRQQTAIQAVLDRTTRPLTPGEILERARQRIPSLGLATVYRSLQRLQDERSVVPVPIPGGPTRYERADLDHHHHFACSSCQRVFEVEGCPKNLDQLAPPGFTVDDHDILLTGTCSDCHKKDL